MSKAEDNYRSYIEYRRAVTKRLCRCITGKSNLDELAAMLDELEKQTQKVFEHDVERIRERNSTISYLQDRLAEK